MTNSSDGPDDRQKYHQLLGRFVERFASVESTLHDFLIWLCELDDVKAAVLLSGTRIDTDISYIRRLYEATGEPLPSPLDKALVQLAHINAVRNVILHNETIHWVRFSEGRHDERGIYTSNTKRVLRGRAIREHHLSADYLRNLTDDTGMIGAVLDAYFRQVSYHGLTQESFLADFEQRPWRCKLPEPARTHPKNPQQPRKQQGPRKSSRK